MMKITFLATCTLFIALPALAAGNPAAAVAKKAKAQATAEKPAKITDGTAFLPNYLKIQEALAKDSMEGVSDAAHAIAASTKSAEITVPARALAGAKDLTAARKAFKELSVPMAAWASIAKPADVTTVYCSMAKGKWLQKKGGIKNPYYGPGMLECGEVQN